MTDITTIQASVDVARSKVSELEAALKTARKDLERAEAALGNAREKQIREEVTAKVREEERLRAEKREAQLKEGFARKLERAQEKAAFVRVGGRGDKRPVSSKTLALLKTTIAEHGSGVLPDDQDQTRALLEALDGPRKNGGLRQGVGDKFEVDYGYERVLFWVEEDGLHFSRRGGR